MSEEGHESEMSEEVQELEKNEEDSDSESSIEDDINPEEGISEDEEEGEEG